MTALAPPPSDPVVAPPARRPGSVRRTSTMLMSWPDGLGTDLHLEGRARDLLTPMHGEPHGGQAAGPLRGHRPRARHPGASRPTRRRAGLQRLVGCRAGANLRSAIAQELPDEVESGTPLLPPARRPGGLDAHLRVRLLPLGRPRPRDPRAGSPTRPRRVMRDICSGFRDGSSSLLSDGTISGVRQNTARPGPLADPGRPARLARTRRPSRDRHAPGAPDRRVGRATGSRDRRHVPRQLPGTPTAHEVVVHEYQITGRGRPGDGDAARRSTPCPVSCPTPSAPGRPRTRRGWPGPTCGRCAPRCSQRLRATDCCTHLNDGLRSLAEVPVLAASLPHDHLKETPMEAARQ